MSVLVNLHSLAASVARLGRGLVATTPRSTQPAVWLELYEFESCPFCRKVRDTLSELDLSYLCHPCARGSANRERVVALGGKAQFPYFVDPNTGTAMYESEDIVTYLHKQYGKGQSALARLAAPLDTASAAVASAVRPVGGRVVALGRRPEQPLTLWTFEASPYSRKAREALHALDLDFYTCNVAKGGGRRTELRELGGKMQVPYLVDPNTGTSMYESDDIVRYLHATYGAAG